MKSIQRIFNTVGTAAAALALAACGGSGTSSSTAGTNGSGGNGTTATVSKLTGVNGFKVNYTPDSANATGWTGTVTSPVVYTSATSINSFALADGASPAHTYSQTGSGGLSAATFVTAGASNLGATSYTYGRFGWLSGAITETNGSSSDWYTPYALASATPTTPTNRSYAGTKQALVYLIGDRSGALSGPSGYAECDASASYTASSQSLQLSFSNCSQAVGYSIAGSLTLANGTGSTSLVAQQLQAGPSQQTMTSSTVDSGNFLLAGPNGEELVGAATLRGSIALTSGIGSSNPALFFVVFGGAKL